jgi:phosphoribosylformylglycinamidine synthase
MSASGGHTARIGVVVFPGINTDHDTAHAISTFAGAEPVWLWHKDTDLRGVEAIVIPGGFSYGDYLRCGAIARFSPIMGAIADFAAAGGLIMGICNGFQILTEAHLLPGALIRNIGLKFVCRYVDLRVENAGTPFTQTAEPGDVLRVVVKHNEGNYRVDPDTLAAMATAPTRSAAPAPTAPSTTSPASATPTSTSSASCRTPRTRSSPALPAAPTAGSSSSRS